MFIQTSEHTSRWGRSLKYGRLREGPPEPKGKIQNPRQVRQVTDRTIHNCFRHAGILSAQGVNVNENEDDVEVEAATAAADDDLPLSKWVRKIDCDVLGHYDYDKYATIDDDIVTTEEQTDEDIVREVRNKNGKLDPEQEEEDKEEEEEEEKAEVPAPSVSETLEAIGVVNRFYKARAESSKIVSQIMGIEGHLENQYWASRRRQMKITDY
jgi:hypothetical protein